VSAPPTQRRRPAVTTVAGVLLLVVGVAVLSLSVGQRLAAQVGVGMAERDATRAQRALDDATTRTAVATDEQNAAAADAAAARRERAEAKRDLAAERQRLSALDYPGRLAALERLVAIGDVQADRFAAMNEAALLDDVGTYNRLAQESNADIDRANRLWEQVLAEESGIEPTTPLV
jgi:hypothetical protein